MHALIDRGQRTDAPNVMLTARCHIGSGLLLNQGAAGSKRVVKGCEAEQVQRLRRHRAPLPALAQEELGGGVSETEALWGQMETVGQKAPPASFYQLIHLLGPFLP